MARDPDTRFTHTLLIVIIVLLTKNGGDQNLIVAYLHAPLLVTLCLFWAYWLPALLDGWRERENGQ